MMNLSSVSSADWGALRIMLVYTLWQGPLVLAVALLSDVLARRRPQAAFATSFGSLLLMPVLAFATYRDTFTALPRGVVEFSAAQVQLAPSAFPWSHLANVVVVASWGSLAALFIARNLVREWYLRRRLLSRCRDLDGPWRQRLFALAAGLRIKRTLQVVVTREEAVPLAFGWLQPVVVLPEAMLTRTSADHVELLVLHELMHLRRKDYPMLLIQHFVRGLFFYNPAVWSLMKLIDQHRELACDRDVLNLGVAPRAYAAALVELEELREVARGMSAGGGDLLGRVRAILNVPRSASPLVRGRWASAFGLAMLGFAAVACAGRDTGAASDYAEAFTVELFDNAVARVNGTLVPDDTAIAVQASRADKNDPAFIHAAENVPFDRIIDVLDSLKGAGLTRIAFARTVQGGAKTVPEP